MPASATTRRQERCTYLTRVQYCGPCPASRNHHHRRQRQSGTSTTSSPRGANGSAKSRRWTNARQKKRGQGIQATGHEANRVKAQLKIWRAKVPPDFLSLEKIAAGDLRLGGCRSVTLG